MRLLICILILFNVTLGYAAGQRPLKVQEEDGDPTAIRVDTITVPNNSYTKTDNRRVTLNYLPQTGGTITGDLIVQGDLEVNTMSGNGDEITITDKIDQDFDITGNGTADDYNILQTNLDGTNNTGTLSQTILKNYMEDSDVVVTGPLTEFTGLGIFIKQLSPMDNGAKSSGISIHEHGSTTERIDYGITTIGNFDAAFNCVTSDTNYGLSFYESVFNEADIRLGKGAEIHNLRAGFVEITSKLDVIKGVTTNANEYGSNFIAWDYAGGTPEHEDLTGTYDHTGGTYEQLFTCTTASFTQDDADNGNHIILTAGTSYVDAMAEIKTFIDTTNVIVDGYGWNTDFVSVTFDIIPHPSVIFADTHISEFSVDGAGKFEVFSYGFTGDTVAEIVLDSNANSTTGLEIKTEVNGNNLVESLLVDVELGDIGNGTPEYNTVLHLKVDETTSSNSDSTDGVDFILFETTDTNAIEKYAMRVGTGFDVALLVTGSTQVAPDYGYEVTTTTVTDRVNSGGAGNDAFINTSVNETIMDNDNDYILIGSDDTFEIIQIILATGANKDNELVYYYSKAGGNWTTLSIVGDTTDGLKDTGQILFNAPGDWTKDNEAEADGDITNAYYIKVQRTANTVSVKPIESEFLIVASLSSGMQIRGDGTIQPTSTADSVAPNDSIYYSTDQSKLVYKDSGGTVNDLY